MIFTLLAAQFVAAQDGFIIYEGTQLHYSVNLHQGNSYAWEVANNLNPPIVPNQGDFEFITDPGFSEVGIQWNVAGLYYLMVTETGADGCSNKKAVAVQVEPNNRSAEFDITASTECFNTGSNSFTLPVNLLDNTGQPLSALYFPMMVEFTVNGTVQSQLVGYNNQLLSINEDWFAADPTQNSDITVEIINVTDAKNATVKPDVTNATHTRTLFAIPEIEFTEELRNRYNLNEKITAYNISSTERVWRMEPK